MTPRGFFARHRIASGLIAPGILGVAALVTLPWALSSGPRTADTELTSSVTECHDMVTVSIAGRGDTPSADTPKLVDANGNALPAALSTDYSSKWLDPVANAPAASVNPNSYASVYVAYPANMDSYESAVTTGVANAESVMQQIQQSCPNTRFAIVGYSEGADVARRVAMDVGHQTADAKGGYGIVNPANVTGVVIFADAGRADGTGPFPGATNPFTNPNGFNQAYQTGTTPADGQGAVQGTGGSDFGALNGRIASFCSDGDLTCSAPQNISLLNLAVNVGRQLNVDSLEKNGLTLDNGQGVAVVLGQIAFNAFQEIRATPNWMQGNETFLDVLLKVSDPAYKPGQTTAVTDTAQDASISTNQMSPLAYLPQKMFKEIVGLIATNQNTIPVVMSDPYNLTLGPDAKGHHFDYWRDANTADGKPLTSSQYAAAWLTQLAQQAQAGQPLDTTVKPDATTVKTVVDQVTATPTPTSAAATTSGTATTSTSTSNSATPTDSASASATTTAPTTAAPTPAANEVDASTSVTPETTSAAPTVETQTAAVVPTTTAAVSTTPTTTPAVPSSTR
ncbi:cutinase family protein [Rhodococcus spelaei]|uniref:Cutinase family protein n=1 Tax=Rhodococcus spelaei TaxID=2546320 RepID=A0A541BNQ3_9NOCA|nr:cutinase family protein [Rhodococcus spelaei]TQF73967.1 cutinase family protein [Rhodococcus spelaei]